jgi:hypothetical protein
MPFTAHDVNQAYIEGVRHERKRIVALMQNYLDNDHIDLADIWDELRQDAGKKLPVPQTYLDIGEI